MIKYVKVIVKRKFFIKFKEVEIKIKIKKVSIVIKMRIIN